MSRAQPFPPDATSARSPVALVAFAVDGRRCAIGLAVAGSAVPMVAVTGLPGAPPGVLGAINVHGRIVPVFDG